MRQRVGLKNYEAVALWRDGLERLEVGRRPQHVALFSPVRHEVAARALVEVGIHVVDGAVQSSIVGPAVVVDVDRERAARRVDREHVRRAVRRELDAAAVLHQWLAQSRGQRQRQPHDARPRRKVLGPDQLGSRVRDVGLVESSGHKVRVDALSFSA